MPDRQRFSVSCHACGVRSAGLTIVPALAGLRLESSEDGPWFKVLGKDSDDEEETHKDEADAPEKGKKDSRKEKGAVKTAQTWDDEMGPRRKPFYLHVRTPSRVPCWCVIGGAPFVHSEGRMCMVWGGEEMGWKRGSGGMTGGEGQKTVEREGRQGEGQNERGPDGGRSGCMRGDKRVAWASRKCLWGTSAGPF